MVQYLNSYGNQNLYSCRSQVVTCEENARTPFTQGEPKIMILKRPQDKVDTAANGMINKQKQPVKSLEQVSGTVHDSSVATLEPRKRFVHP